MSEQAAYYKILDETLLGALRDGISSFADLCRISQGASPAEVLSAIRRLQIEVDYLNHSSDPWGDIKQRFDEPWWPEPSPSDYEWRFTRSTAEFIGALASKSGRRILCLGTPTVFRYLVSQGVDAHLVDRNPLLTGTFPKALQDRILTVDVSELSKSTPANSYDLVVMDPPWYSDHFAYWIQVGADLVSKNGNLIFPIFPALIRPSAIGEREALLKAITHLGSSRIIPDAVIYETPLFERETLSGLGVPYIDTWRKADLITLKLSARPNSDLPAPQEDQWRHFLFGTQVISLRNLPQDKSSITIRSPYDSGSFLLRSVSARDPARSIIGLWTSRNRAAVVTGAHRIVKFLDDLEHGVSPNLAVRSAMSNQSEKVALDTLIALIGW